MKKEKTPIPVEVEYTDGYQQRFTKAILDIYEKRKREPDNKDSEIPHKERVS